MNNPVDFKYDSIIALSLNFQRLFIKTATNGQRESQSRYEEEISHLNSNLSTIREELTNMRIEKDELELKAGIAPTLERKTEKLLIHGYEMKNIKYIINLHRKSPGRGGTRQSHRGKIQ